jgi:tetratricopeptide (TPR) repeat protein
VQDVLGRSDAEVFPSGREMKVADLLDEADEKAAERFAGRPGAEMEARLRLGRSYLSLAMFEEAAGNLRRARELAAGLRGEDDELTLRVTGRLVDALRAPRPRESEELARKAFAAASARYGLSHARTREARRNLADTLSAPAVSKHDEALPLYMDDLRATRADPAVTTTQLAYIHGDVGWVLYCCGRFTEAEPYLRQNVELAERSPDAPRHLRAFAPYMLALLLDAAGEDVGADDYYRRSLERVVAWRGEAHRDARRVRAAYANFLIRLGQYDRALRLRREAFGAAASHASASATSPNNSAVVADAAAELADAMVRAGDANSAAVMLTRAIETRRRAAGDDDPTAREWWRKFVAWSAVAGASGYRSEALSREVWCATEEMLAWQAPGRFGPNEDALWKPSRFRLERRNSGGGAAALVVVAGGEIERLRALDDPVPGLYRLGVETGRTDGRTARTQAWVLFCDWDVAVYPLPDTRPEPYVWDAVTARPPARRGTTRSLALTGSTADTGATGGRVSHFGLVATASPSLPAGTYRFSVTANDGVRLWVNDQLIVDAWRVRPATTAESTVTLPDGPQRLRVEYFQARGPYGLWLRVAPVAATAP